MGRACARGPFAVGFVLLFMTYANLFKNVSTWTGSGVVPEAMKPPLIGGLLPAWLLAWFTALTWFNLAWLSLSAVLIALMAGDATVSAPEHAHKRFGPEAAWRIKPILKEGRHR